MIVVFIFGHQETLITNPLFSKKYNIYNIFIAAYADVKRFNHYKSHLFRIIF